MKRKHTIITGLAGALSLTVLTAFAAGPGYGMGAPRAMGPGMGPGMGPMGGPCMMQGAGPGTMRGAGPGRMQGPGPGMMAAQDLDAVKARLAITAEQESAWQAYAGKVGEQAVLMQAMWAQRRQPVDPATPAPERMAQHLALMEQRLAGMQGVQAALKDLYAALTPEQRTLANQQLAPMGARGPAGPQGRGGPMGPIGRGGAGPCTTG